MPNTLVASKFVCPFSELEAVVKKGDKEQGSVFSSVEDHQKNEHKARILINFSDMEKFGSMLEQPKLKKWNVDYNCIDKVYNLN